MNFLCKIFGHHWSLGQCVRCGDRHENHRWTPVDGKCGEVCRVCGETRSVAHSFVEKFPCLFICSNCGVQEQRHDFIKKSDCVKVCSRCGKVEEKHRWNTVYKELPSETFWTMTQMRIFDDKLPKDSCGCSCEICGETNSQGTHVCATAWEGDFLVTKCKHCETICKQQTSSEVEARRYAADVNADEGIFQ